MTHTTEQQVELLEKFIKNNNLTFTEGNRNSDSCIISGYGLYIGITNWKAIEYVIDKVLPKASDEDYEDELERVFNYAKANNYGKFWKQPGAKTMYKF